MGIAMDKIDSMLDQFEKNFDAKLGRLRKDLNEDFRQHISNLIDDLQHKFQHVVEGHQILSEKLDRVEENLENKMDTISTELAAHRADTEGHKRGYVVSVP
jgi:hypothetical protein